MFKDFFTQRKNKFWVAIAGAIIATLTSLTGIDIAYLGITPEALVTWITAIFVYLVPNRRT